MKLIVASILVLLTASSIAQCVTVWVPQDQPTIQAGLTVAVSGDTVRISCGSYNEYQINVPSGVFLVSETGLPECVTIDAAKHGPVLICQAGPETTVINGITIANGFSPFVEGAGVRCLSGSDVTLDNCIIRSCETIQVSGGGLYSESGSFVRIHDCRLYGNAAGYRGGGAFFGGSASITDSEFSSNRAGLGAGLFIEDAAELSIDSTHLSGNVAIEGGGGADICGVTSARITSTVVLDNQSLLDGGGLRFSGGTAGLMTDCLIEGNTAGDLGGGIAAFDGTSISLEECLIRRNTAACGGGVACDSSSPSFTKCTLSGNASTNHGGALYCYQAAPSLTQCTLVGNATAGTGTIYCKRYSAPQLEQCIVAFNDGGGAVTCVSSSVPVFTQDCVFACSSSDSLCGSHAENIFTDPLMCGFGAGDYSLCADSPCLPAGNIWEVQMGALGAGCGPCATTVNRSSWGQLKSSYRP